MPEISERRAFLPPLKIAAASSLRLRGVSTNWRDPSHRSPRGPRLSIPFHFAGAQHIQIAVQIESAFQVEDGG
jgi:hypothetical protein